MKMIVAVALALVAIASAAPVEEKRYETISSIYEQGQDGSFQQSYETENGIEAKSFGELKQGVDADNKPVTYLVIRGSYSYPGEDGKPVEITYTADQNGFHPEGASIPKALRR